MAPPSLRIRNCEDADRHPRWKRLAPSGGPGAYIAQCHSRKNESGVRRFCTYAQGGDDLRVSVLTGLDVLASESFSVIKGNSVGALCHHASVDKSYRHITKLLIDGQKEGGFQVKCAFSPEHGLWGAKDSRIQGTNVDSRTGLVVHSLYGQTYRPTKEMLDGVDMLLIDLQDVGARFYT